MAHTDHTTTDTVCIVFMQGDDAIAVLDLWEDDTDAAWSELTQYDYGTENDDAARYNGMLVGDTMPPYAGDTYARDGYIVVLNHHVGTVALYRPLLSN